MHEWTHLGCVKCITVFHHCLHSLGKCFKCQIWRHTPQLAGSRNQFETACRSGMCGDQQLESFEIPPVASYQVSNTQLKKKTTNKQTDRIATAWLLISALESAGRHHRRGVAAPTHRASADACMAIAAYCTCKRPVPYPSTNQPHTTAFKRCYDSDASASYFRRCLPPPSRQPHRRANVQTHRRSPLERSPQQRRSNGLSRRHGAALLPLRPSLTLRGDSSSTVNRGRQERGVYRWASMEDDEGEVLIG